MSHDLRHNFYLRVLLLVYFASLLLFLALNIELELFRYGLTPSALIANLLGNEELFIRAKDLTTLMTEIHVNLFLYPLAQLTTLSTLVHLKMSDRAKVIATLSSTVFILMDIGGVLLIRFVAPWTAWLKVIGFWGFEVSMFLMVIMVLGYLLGKPQGHPVHHG
ncbi:MAG: hypothetical protein IT288_02090 [Bdellovibrionales bacterium]|nr:hypothetical protein [Bdellovibrionales bacterium]